MLFGRSVYPVATKIKSRSKRDDHTIKLPSNAGSIAERMRAPAEVNYCLVVLGGLNIGAVIRLESPEVSIGRDSNCGLVLTDDGISREHAALRREDDGYVIEDLESTNGVFVNGERISKALLQEGDKILVGQSTVLKYTFQDELELEYQNRLHESLSRDPLTGALNRRALDERLVSEWSFAVRHGTSLSVLMVDVDHFKRINDTYGHSTGDEILREIGHAITAMIRKEDVFGRYGGEEFVIVARGVGHNGAIQLARRIRDTISAIRLLYESTTIPVTVSVGVATADQDYGESYQALLELADKRLYEAKRGGRDREVG